jgi:Carboxypeptidase regulatory-like domain/TonB dependent receptor
VVHPFLSSGGTTIKAVSILFHSALRCGAIAVLVCATVVGIAVNQAFAQALATLQGVITDASGAAIANAKITSHNLATGEERTARSDPAGSYALPSLPSGSYRLTVSATGMKTTDVNGINLDVGQVVAQNVSLGVASGMEVVEVNASTALINTETTTVGQVVNSRTVQDIPLNGRHFLDMGFLIPGSVTPPQNANLGAPLRGQGFFGFNTAGAREDTVNFMVNGINLADFGGGNQITFQPTIGTISEFKVENHTFRAEYGFKVGAIVNMATRSGTNSWHGEAYDFLRNNDLDARNYENPTTQVMAPFHRNQFGGNAGGPIRKDKLFIYLSYEGLRQVQSVPLSATVLSTAQRAQAQTSSDSVVQSLLTLIPVANSPGNVYQSEGSAPVTNDQGTVNISDSLSDTHQVSVYYAYQADFRNEPPTTVNNNLPGYGDLRTGHRQILTISDVKTLSGTMVNEFHLGYNRLHLPFNPQAHLTSAAYGINNGVAAFPQININGGALEFGGNNNEPVFRGDYTAVASDSLNWVRGKQTIKFGGEFRRNTNNNYSYTPGTFTFPTVAAFLSDQANGFTANASNRANRIAMSALAVYGEDSYKWSENLLLEFGLRYEWNGTPVEAKNRFVVFEPATISLVDIGTTGAPSKAYNQNALNFEPRVGFSWRVFGSKNAVLRGAYSIGVDSPNTGQVVPLAQNPPFANPVSFSPSTSQPYVSFTNAYSLASSTVSPTSIVPSYKNDYVQSWNLNVQQQVGSSMSMMIGYFASKGTHQNVETNANQLISGQKPYPTLSPTSPIDPARSLGTVTVMTSGSNSAYNALWVTVTRRMAKGLQFNGSYTFSKSMDDNSRTAQGIVVQNSYNIHGDWGLSDFDARSRFSFNGIYQLPFQRNRLVSGWQVAPIITLQSGNPISFKTSNAAFTGVASLRPSVTGPVYTGLTAPTNNNPTFRTYVKNPSVFVAPTNGFGNLPRNVILGPGFSDVDLALYKNTPIGRSADSSLMLQFRADAFDMFNHPNFGQPNVTVGSSTFGLINTTRFPTGDSGSSRQLQLALKLLF